jgi:hypothetical protein
MHSRLAEVGDLWQGIAGHQQSLQGPITALQGLLTEADWTEAMAASTRRPTSRKGRVTSSR